MKITIELTSLEDVKAVVAALEGRNAQAVLPFSPSPQFAESQAGASLQAVKAPPAAKAVTTKDKVTKTKKSAEVSAEPNVIDETLANGQTSTVEITEAPVTVEQVAGDIDDATMREVGGKLLRELNAKAKDGVGELTKILSSLGSKKVTEVPMNLRPRFIAKVTEALA